MRGRPLLSAIVMVALGGCGRTQLSPWGAPFDAGATVDAPADVGPEDGPPPSDGPSPDVGDAVDAGPIAFSCAALAGLVAKGPLTTRRTRQALFTADGSTLLLRVAGQGGATSDDLLPVSLPSGSFGTVVPGVTNAEWLGGTGRVLLTRPGGALTALALDVTLVRTLIGASCEHVIAPDGGRVYALTGCDTAGTAGTLVAIDVVTGTTTPLSTAVLRQTLVVSPDSNWVAYQLGPPAGDGGAAVTGTIQISSRDNAGYTLGYLAGTRRPAFTPTNELLFVTATDAGTLAVADIYRHVPGSGTAVARVAASRNVGTGGYHVSPDGALLLAARFPPASPMLDELYAVHLDGSGETLLASNLAPYQLNQIGPSVFAFSADGRRAIYTSSNFSGTSSVGVAGGTISFLASGGTFGISAAGDRIAVIDRMGATPAVDTLHLIDAATNAEKIALDAVTIDSLTFVPGGGLLFVEVPASGQRLLRHFKLGGSAFTTLAQWNVSQYWTQRTFFGELPASAGYPTDPTGCYAVVDSDTTTPAGTSLVLLP